MSEKNYNGFTQMFQGGVRPMPFGAWGQAGNQNSEENQERKENIKSTMKTAWTQRIDRKKSSVDNARQQWKQFFQYMMEMQDTFSASLPDDLSSLPYGQMLPMSPKAFMERVKDFEKMANEHLMAQADSVADFCIKGQEQFYDMVTSAIESKDAAKAPEEDTADNQND